MRRLTLYPAGGELPAALQAVALVLHEERVEMERVVVEGGEMTVRRYQGVSVLVSDEGARRIRSLARARPGWLIIGSEEPVGLADVEEIFDRQVA